VNATAALAATCAGAILIASGRAATPAAPRQQGAPYRGGADLVSIYATATDRDGRLVPDLTRDDFEVRDNGRRQPLTVFSNELQPITIVVMLDRSFSMSDHADVARDGATAFVKAMRPGDGARIGSFADEIRLSPDHFTGDQTALLAIVDGELQDAGASPVWTAVDRSITALRQEAGRRVVLLFSDGYDQPVRGQVFTELDDVLRRARINDIMVYAIGFPSDKPPSLPFAARGGHVMFGAATAKQRAPHRSLKTLAEESGGGYVEWHPLQPIARLFTRVAEELHRQYWLGFAPRALDGKIHRLDVRVKRDGVTVRARRTYVAESAPPAPGEPARPGVVRCPAP
jgi:Ca-activated chloride channel family protein